MHLQDALTELKGIGEKSAETFRAAGISDINSLLHYFPRTYTVLPEFTAIGNIAKDGRYTVRGKVLNPPSAYNNRGRNVISFYVGDGTGRMKVSCFHMPYIRSRIRPGMEYILFGACRLKGTEYIMGQPAFFSEEQYMEEKGKLNPVYPLHGDLTNTKIIKALKTAIPLISEIREYLPEDVLSKEKLLSIPQAIRMMHFPENMEEVSAARKRLAFDEIFLFLSKMELLKQGPERRNSLYVYDIVKTSEILRQMEEQLPYTLTDAQKRTVQEILRDLSSGYCMNRLVQGDVGSGKTIVAILAALAVVSGGGQAALMAPTEVLALQHYEDICHMTEVYSLPFHPVLLTGSVKGSEKKKRKEQMASGEANLMIGTQALIQEDVAAKELALIITDEQHRFGVRQRMTLAGKGKEPHVLVMSATPIPRTLGLILYGDLDVSLIDELPASRLPIKNTVVDASYRTKLYQFILKRIREGRQAYIICPMVEEGEDAMEELANVTEYTDTLRRLFPGQIRIDMLHGRMKPVEKKEIMERFSRGDTDILVSTTVVEVGVNVPNATVMMVENAERFGLAQLHQLRGRVGRGKWQSYCIFIAGGDNGEVSKKTQERLHILAETNDGFRIAEEDLKQRGPGDFFGVRQSGLPYFKIADIYADAEMLKRIKGIVADLCQNSPESLDALKKALEVKESMDYIDFHGICL